jgi:hypothetical protein
MPTSPRSLAALLLALLAAPAASAQIPSFGAAAGINFASLGDATATDLDNATGFHVGVYADLGIGPLSVRPGVFYVRAGRVLTSDEQIDYVAIPVDLRFSTGTPLVRPYALVGPEARIPTGEVFGEDTRSFALAANVGVGVELGGLVLPNAFAELRYGLDLSGLRDDPDVDESVKVNVVMIRVGVGM